MCWVQFGSIFCTANFLIHLGWPHQPAADSAGINANSQLEVSLSDKFLPQSTWVQQHFRFFALRFMLDGWTDRTVSSLVLALDSSRRPLRSKSPPRRGYYFYRYYFRRIVYNNTHHREAKLNQVYVLARWIMIWLRKRIFFSLSLFVEGNLFVRVLVIKKIFIARSPDRFSGLTFQHLQDFFFPSTTIKN